MVPAYVHEVAGQVRQHEGLRGSEALNVRAAGVSGSHGVLVTKGGRTFSWGDGRGGRLGNGSVAPTSGAGPVRAEVLDARRAEQLSCGAHHSAVLTREGDVFTWGDDRYSCGLLGHGLPGRPGAGAGLPAHRAPGQPAEICWLPKRVERWPAGAGAVTHVACGAWHTAAVTEAGALFTWGCGFRGRLGHGEARGDEGFPRLVAALCGKRVTHVACGEWHTAAVVDTEAYSAGDGEQAVVSPLFTWGWGGKGSLGYAPHGGAQATPRAVPGIFFDTSKLRQVSCGECHTAALDVEGGVYFSGFLGSACEAEVFTRAAGPLRWERVAQLASGAHHLAAVTASGRCYTWGAGKDGQLGHGEAADRAEPTEVGRLAGRVVLQVSCGERCTAAVCEHTSLEAQTEFREKIEATKEMFAAASTAAMRRKAGAAGAGGSGGSGDSGEEHTLVELKIRGRRRPARGLRRRLRQLLRLVGLRRGWRRRGARGGKGGKGPPAGGGKGASAKFQNSVKAIGAARALSGTPGGAPADTPAANQPSSGSLPPSEGRGVDATAAPANPTADMAQLALRIADLEQQLAAERAAAAESPERSPGAPGAPTVTNGSAEGGAGQGEAGERAPGKGGYPSRGGGGGGDLLSLRARELQVPPSGDAAGGDRSHWLPFLWGRGEAPQTEVSGLEEANRALKEEVALLRSQLEGTAGLGRGIGPHDPSDTQQQQQQQQQHWRNAQTPAPLQRGPPTLVSVQDVASVDYSTLVQKSGAAHALGGRRLFPEAAPGAAGPDPLCTPGGAPLDVAASPSARRASIGGASPPAGAAWVEEVDEGVFLSLERTATGSNILKGVRFGRDVFSQKDAEAYWDAQKVAIAVKYNLGPTGARGGARHRRAKSSA